MKCYQCGQEGAQVRAEQVETALITGRAHIEHAGCPTEYRSLSTAETHELQRIIWARRDPARPYCREPETCGGSCRRDPACCE